MDSRFTIYVETTGGSKIIGKQEKPDVMEYISNVLDKLHSSSIIEVKIKPCLSAGKYGRM